MLALSLAFTDDWIIRWFGSYLQPASITWLSYAKTLMRVPLGVVGQGVGVASFPFLSQLYSEGKLDELNRLLDLHPERPDRAAGADFSAHHRRKRAARLPGFLAHAHARRPISTPPRRRWSFFPWACFAWGAQNILARGFYATRNTWIPAIVGTVLTFASLPVYWVLCGTRNIWGWRWPVRSA